jgi:hypothetical protein
MCAKLATNSIFFALAQFFQKTHFGYNKSGNADEKSFYRRASPSSPSLAGKNNGSYASRWGPFLFFHNIFHF